MDIDKPEARIGMDEWLISLTQQIETLIVQIAGPGAEVHAVGNVPWSAVWASVLYLTLVVAVNTVVASLLRRRERASAEESLRPWQSHAIVALGKPLYVFIWIYGLYVAATPVLMALTRSPGLNAVHAVVRFALKFGALVAIVWVLLRLIRGLEARLTAWAATTYSKIDDLLVPLLGSAARVVLILVAIETDLPMLNLPPRYSDAAGNLTSIVFILAIAGLLVRTVTLFRGVVFSRYDMTAADNLQARKVYTQLQVISRVMYAVIALVAVASILMLFEPVRQIGTSLLASAGVAGIIVGFAAQKTLANLFAGFQIALAQPVRQDDVVVVEGEWGRIEEITLTYVVVRIWDDRRLILPLSYFIEKPFQNWTRASSAIMGSVFVWVDYAFPVDEARTALKAIIESSALWDKRFWNLQLTDATEQSLQLRVLATAADSSRCFDLRCEIREKFVAYIQRAHPQALPRSRVELSSTEEGWQKQPD
jgi:small-conductance mechanosensitive channel